MTTVQLGTFIVLCSAVIIGVTSFAFIKFSRFIERERVRSERFRDIHGPPGE